MSVPTAKLADPPISGGRVEALAGHVIRVLSRSPLARPVPAVALSSAGLAGTAFLGLCATPSQDSAVTPPVLLPLTALARRLGAPSLPVTVGDVIMDVSVALCCLGLAMMLWANSRGWTPDPRKLLWAASGVVAVLVNITPAGSADIASYAAYGRIAALGHNPYTWTPLRLPGGLSNPYTAVVSPRWRATPSVYGPVATWMHQLAAMIGGERPWLTIWVLMIATGAAFIAGGYLLLRTAANPSRALLLWAVNPLLIVELVLGGHLDTFVALLSLACVVLSRRRPGLWTDLGIGLLVGIAAALKINAVFVALGIAIPLLHDRAWLRLARTAAVSAVTVAALYLLTWGTTFLKPLSAASRLVIAPSGWRLAQLIVRDEFGEHALRLVTGVFGYLWPLLTLALAWYLYNRLSPDVPSVVAGTCALTFAWVIVAPWSMPWYASIAWITLALLPRNSLTRWLTLTTGVLALFHFNGRFPDQVTGPAP
ncbi:MAG: hypothetical protein FWE35_16515 [Streptosporangiales bacterium]|nr:hypothetical protein [Streptosporangiales bacterium]